MLEWSYFSSSEAEPSGQVPTTGSTTSPRERLFFSKAHTPQCPAKRNTWYSLSVLAYIKSFFLDAQQAADLGLRRPRSPCPFQAVTWLHSPWRTGRDGPALPSRPLHRLLNAGHRQRPVFHQTLIFYLNYLLEDKWLCMSSLPILLKPHKAPLHTVY